MRTIVSKSEYAVLKGRAKSAVSNWIAEGKISRGAIIGEGIRARIWVERADADLATGLDPAQQAAQEKPIGAVFSGERVAVQLEGSVEADAVRPSSVAGRDPLKPGDDLARRRKADADRAESDAEMARRRLAVDEGRWIEAGEAGRAWSAELGRHIAETETFLGNTLARELADLHGLDWRALSGEIRAAYRRFRTSVADRAAAERVDREAALADAAE